MAFPETARPAHRATGGEPQDAFPGGNCSSDLALRTHAAQAKIELLLDDIGCNISAMQVTFDCAIAMRLAGDTTGLIYALRRCRAYWRAITASAAELVAADAERLSALRQGEAR